MFAQVACTAAIKTKNDRKNRNRDYESQIYEPYPVEKFQSTRGRIKRNEQNHSQVKVTEAPKKMQVKYIQLHFIPYLQSDRIPLFEASLRRSNSVGKMSQELPHLNFRIGERPK